jgi:predicted alpha/beta hydrolase family esterase
MVVVLWWFLDSRKSHCVNRKLLVTLPDLNEVEQEQQQSAEAATYNSQPSYLQSVLVFSKNCLKHRFV